MRLAGNIALFLAGLALGFAASEVLIRIFIHEAPLDGTNLVYQIDDRIGWKYAPNQVGMKRSGCYLVDPITINEFGFRDDTPWEGNRIALVGDSFVAAAEVADADYLGKKLEQRLGKGVMNAASAQGYNTIQEYRVFTDYVAIYRPAAVILLFFLGNDVLGNGCETSKFDLPQNYRLRPCGIVGADGTITIKEPEIETKDLAVLNDFPALKVFLKQHCRTCTMGWKWIQGNMRDENARDEHARGTDVQEPGMSEKYQREIEDSWLVTEAYLAHFNDAVTEAGGTLVVAALPDLQTLNDTDWAEPAPWELYADPGRLRAVVEDIGAQYLDLEAPLRAYQKAHALSAPYFSYPCDLHFTPLGHAAVADMIADFLSTKVF